MSTERNYPKSSWRRQEIEMIKTQAETMTNRLRAAQACISEMQGTRAATSSAAADREIRQENEAQQRTNLGLMSAAVEQEKCIGCGICIDVCREEAVSFHSDLPFVVIDTERCSCCGICAHECPVEAITLPDLNGASF